MLAQRTRADATRNGEGLRIDSRVAAQFPRSARSAPAADVLPDKGQTGSLSTHGWCPNLTAAQASRLQFCRLEAGATS